MASARLRSKRSGLKPWPGTCVVFLGKTLYSHGASLTQVYKWVPANLMLEVTLRWTSNPSRGEKKIPPFASCYRNPEKLRPDGPFGSNADFTSR